MKTLTKTFLAAIITLIAISCTQNDFEAPLEKDLQTIENGTLNFIYKGTLYSSEYSKLSDSTVIFENNQVSELSKLLATKSNLITYIHPDGALEYIETPEEAEAKVSKEISITTKGSGPLLTYCVAECELYRHTNYKGWNIHQLIDYCNGPRAVVEKGLSSSKDNKISSIKVFTRRGPNENAASQQYAGSLRLYQYNNLTGNSLILPFTPVWNEINISSLKSYPLYPGSKENWNDTVSSYTFGFN